MKYFYPADILIPDFGKTDGTRWAVIACDQFTGEPEYWKNVADTVGDEPSTLKIIIPEAFLAQTADRLPLVNGTMEYYLEGILHEHKNSMIYVERTQSDGRVRHGIVGAVDLEDYDYGKNAHSSIRATEGTVLERIPPRVAVRRGACIEAPHVMLLVNDPANTVFSELEYSRENNASMAYDFPLMLGGGHIKGRFLNDREMGAVSEALENIAKEDAGSENNTPILFAIGDCNHSLASAKALYEELKTQIGTEKAQKHPARYALAEVVNIYDTALDFEPIYRILTNCETEDVIKALERYALDIDSTFLADDECKPQVIRCFFGDKEKAVTVKHPKKKITVATLEAFLEEYMSAHPWTAVDYIHDEDSVHELSQKENTVGFIFDGITKDGFFEAIEKDGAFPRKTFSMGHARDKRYYLECRKIVE